MASICDLGGAAEVALRAFSGRRQVRPRRRREGRRRALPRVCATSAAPRRSQTRSPAVMCDLGGAAEVADALSRVHVRPRRRRGGRRRALPRACATSAAPRRSQTRSPAVMCDLGGAAEVADALKRDFAKIGNFRLRMFSCLLSRFPSQPSKTINVGDSIATAPGSSKTDPCASSYTDFKFYIVGLFCEE